MCVCVCICLCLCICIWGKDVHLSVSALEVYKARNLPSGCASPDLTWALGTELRFFRRAARTLTHKAIPPGCRCSCGGPLLSKCYLRMSLESLVSFICKVWSGALVAEVSALKRTALYLERELGHSIGDSF